MLIFDDNNNPILIDSIHTPTIVSHMWVLDLKIMDFALAPILVFEEMICSTLLIRIRGFDFAIPAKWNILVADKETSQLDVIEISKAAGKEFTALLFGPKKSNPQTAVVTVMDYYLEYKNYAPSLHKHQMLCHPIGPDEWVSIAPSDAYNKYLKDRAIGDLVA